MDREDVTLAAVIIGVLLQAVGIWQNRKRKPKKPKQTGRHRRE